MVVVPLVVLVNGKVTKRKSKQVDALPSEQMFDEFWHVQ
jgi:hypothetical protein